MPETVTLNNCTVITVDGKDTFFPSGRIVIAGDRIVSVTDDSGPVGGTVLDMGGALVMPGLVNTHTHSHSSIFRCLGDDLRLMDWLNNVIWPLEKSLTSECIYAAVQLSCLEFIRGGITTYADQIYFADTVADAAQKSGLRCFLAATVFSMPSPETNDTFGAAVRFIEKWRGREQQTKVYPCIGPHAPYSVDGGLFRKVAAFAREHDLLLHTHISETTDENNSIRKKTNLSPVRWLDSLGVFDCSVLAAHSIHLDENDIAVYARNKAAVSYNPVSNLKLVSGVMPLAAMIRYGVTVGIGTDGAQSNNSLDLLRDLRTGVLIQKQWNDDAEFLNAREAVRMATIEGAKALRMDDEIGSLEPGKKADLIAFNPKSPRLCPLHRSRLDKLYSAICYSAYGGDVYDVMVDGRWLMKHGKILNLDEDEIIDRAQRASEYLLK